MLFRSQTVVFGSTFTGYSLAEDLQKGIIDRFRSLPMAESAVLFGRTLSDVVNNVISLAVMASRVLGLVRDQVFAGLQYTPSKREYVLGELFSRQYYTQDERTKIGSSYGLNWEAGHRFRTEYPDLHVRLAGSINHFSLTGSGDAATAALNPAGTIPGASFFLPGSFSVYGIYTGFGTYYRTNYTRALRPFVDVGVNRNTVTGSGYAAMAGISGSVIGLDRLTLYASTGRGGTGTNETSREIGLRYMYLFDNF